jgi:hypothetical protein
MKGHFKLGRRSALAVLLLAISVASPAARSSSAADKIKLEELVAKHLESIGAAVTRASVKSRIVSGTVVATFRTPGTGQVSGLAVLASEGEKNLLGMSFGSSNNNYPFERFGFNGDDVTASYLRPGARSTLGNFLLMHKAVIRQGILGGALSQAWPLYDLEAKKPKLELGGTKKIGERQAYEVKYFPRGGSDLHVSLYFDAETFQHVRTEYTRTIAAQLGSTPETSAQQRETRYRMVEDFSDFRKESGLTLPHKYTLLLEETGSTSGSFNATWEMALTQFAFNQPIDPKSFDVGTGD